jgi:hypothetical protein
MNPPPGRLCCPDLGATSPKHPILAHANLPNEGGRYDRVGKKKKKKTERFGLWEGGVRVKLKRLGRCPSEGCAASAITQQGVRVGTWENTTATTTTTAGDFGIWKREARDLTHVDRQTDRQT